MNTTPDVVQDTNPTDEIVESLIESDDSADTSSTEDKDQASANATRVLADLLEFSLKFSKHVQQLNNLHREGNFKYTSKETRVAMLDTMVAKIDELDETTKVAFRTLKRVKRERVPDKLVDEMLMFSATMAGSFR